MPYDLATIRSDFPILARTVHGKPLVYLDNGATSQKPRAVVQALVDFYERHNANIHRGAHGLGAEATGAYEQARGMVERFVGAHNGNEIVFTRNTTESINLVASAWGRANVQAGDEIALPASEHHANVVPWYLLAKEKGAKLVWLPLDAEGRVDLGAAAKLIGPRCKVLTFSWVSNVLGGVNPVRALAALGKAQGALVFVDAAQAAPHFALNLKDMGVDAAAFSAHKMLGPTGVGVLWAQESLLESMPPYQGGGSMISTVTPELITWNRLPWKFEAGTPNIADVVAFGAALKYLKALGWDELTAHEARLTAHGLEALKRVEGLKLFGPASPQDRVAVFSFQLEGVDPSDAGALLDAQGIEVRVGHHCCQPLMEHLGVPGLIRASAYLYNSEQELDLLAEGLGKVLRTLAKPRAPGLTMTATLPERLQAMVDELAAIDDLEEKYLLLIELGEQLPDIPADRKTEACLIHGCQSVVHAYATLEDGKLRLHGYADAKIVNGLLALLALGLDGLSPQAFLAVDPRFIERTGVIKTLTPSRVNGFYNIHEKFKAEALIALGKLEGKA